MARWFALLIFLSIKSFAGPSEDPQHLNCAAGVEVSGTFFFYQSDSQKGIWACPVGPNSTCATEPQRVLPTHSAVSVLLAHENILYFVEQGLLKGWAGGAPTAQVMMSLTIGDQLSRPSAGMPGVLVTHLNFSTQQYEVRHVTLGSQSTIAQFPVMARQALAKVFLHQGLVMAAYRDFAGNVLVFSGDPAQQVPTLSEDIANVLGDETELQPVNCRN